MPIASPRVAQQDWWGGIQELEMFLLQKRPYSVSVWYDTQLYH